MDPRNSKKRKNSEPIFHAYERPTSFAGTECSTVVAIRSYFAGESLTAAIEVRALLSQIPDKDPNS
jgi:hypothetical protein